MHLGNGALTPQCAAAAAAVAAGGLGLAFADLRRTGVPRERLLAAGALSGAIFAAQMINVPLLPFASAHLVGGVLAAWALGPSLGALSMAVVLATQALLLGDGGLMALGANIVNMALLPAGLVRLFERRTSPAAIGVLAGTAVLAAALAIVAEVALFRTPEQAQGLWPFALRIVGIHAWIAVPEGLLTVGILACLGEIRSPGALRLDHGRLAACWGASAILILCLLPLASSMPDGYEQSAQSTGMEALLSDEPAELSSLSRTNAAVAAWQRAAVQGFHDLLATEQVLALAGTGATSLAVFGFARCVNFAQRKPT